MGTGHAPGVGAATVAVSVRYLSAVREKAGTRRDDLSLPPGATLADAAAWIRRERGIEVPGPGLMGTLNGHGWTQLPAGTATALNEGDEIALFPLLSGG
jgi:molybdopterin converting factor small subunit